MEIGMDVLCLIEILLMDSIVMENQLHFYVLYEIINV